MAIERVDLMAELTLAMESETAAAQEVIRIAKELDRARSRLHDAREMVAKCKIRIVSACEPEGYVDTWDATMRARSLT